MALPLLGPLSALAQRTPRIDDLERRVRADSNDAVEHYQLAMAYWDKRRYDDAERSLQTAILIERRFAPAYLALAYLPYARRSKLLQEEARGRIPEEWRPAVEESARLRRRAFLLDPLVDLQILGRIISLGAGRQVRGGRVRIVADPYYAFVQGNYGFAYDAFNGAVAHVAKRQPRDSIPSRLLWYRGLSAGHIGIYDTALADFRTLLSRGVAAEQGDSVYRLPLATNDYRYILALFQYRSRRFADAMATYQEALTNDLGLFMAHVQMGRMYEDHEMWPHAVAAFERAVATNPEDPSLLLDLGVILCQAGRHAAAESVLTQAMESNPRDSRVPYHLGIAFQQDGKHAEARSAFERFISLAPSRYARYVSDARARMGELPAGPSQ